MKIQDLSTPERILLAEALWESIRTNADEVTLATAHVELPESRLKELESDGELGDSWQNVKARLLS